jgi:tRNA A-37 threonylcarbamoyl transferase component Bud32
MLEEKINKLIGRVRDNKPEIKELISECKEFVECIKNMTDVIKYKSPIIKHIFPKNKNYQTIIGYDARFDIRDTMLFMVYNYDPHIVNDFDDKFSGINIVHFLINSLNSKLVNQFDEKFSFEEILNFENLIPDYINKFKGKFDINEIIYFYIKDYDLDLIDKYDKRFSGFDITEFIERGYEYDLVNEYDERFSAIDILSAFDHLKHENRFIGPDVANDFDVKFSAEDIYNFTKFNLYGDDVNEYDERFSVLDIIFLNKAKCCNDIAKEYDSIFDGLEIAILYSIGINQNRLDNDKKKIYINIHKYIANDFKNKEIKSDFNFIGMGGTAIIIQKNNRALKFSNKNVEQEAKILERLDDSDYIVKIKETRDIVMELEYVSGQTLEEIFQESKEPLSEEQTIVYSTQLFSALSLMYEKEVYHRDLWLGNIMADGEKVKIIDFGEATLEPNAEKCGSRRYRGKNDIDTLGQLMYKFATGKNLYNTNPYMSTAMMADQVLENIEEAKSDEKVLEQRLMEVDDNVQNENIKKIIKTCLTAESKKDNSNFAKDECYERLEYLFSSYSQ